MQFVLPLEKSVEALQLALVKHDVKEIKPCQVHMVMDISGSFIDEHHDGYTQQLMNRFVPFSMLFDKDKILGSFAFGSSARQLEDITERNYADYIAKEMPYRNGGTTNYADAFRLMLGSIDEKPVQKFVTEHRLVTKQVAKPQSFMQKMLGKAVEYETVEVLEPVQVPVATPPSLVKEKHLFFFVTDGSPDSEREAETMLSSLIRDEVFIVFISINSRPVNFLTKFARQPYAFYINYTPDELHKLQNVSDEALYDSFLASQHFVNWMNK